MRDSLSEAGLRILVRAKDLALEHRAGLSVTTELIEESTAYALSDASAGAFEVVVGHRGLGGFGSLLLGSTGLRVAAHASGPVVIVRGEDTGATATAGAAGAEGARGEIAAGTDLSEASAEALEYAFDAAALRKARLRVVHAWQLSETLMPAGNAADVAEIEQSVRQALARRLMVLRDRHPDVTVTDEVVREHPVSALVGSQGPDPLQGWRASVRRPMARWA